MADLSTRIAKRFSLGSGNPNSADTVFANGVTVNLATQSLPIQGGQIGYFGGALLVVTTGAFTGAGSIVVKLQGSLDNSNFFDILTVATEATSYPTVSASTKVGISIPGPLPQYVRAKTGAKTGTVNSLADGVSAEVVVIG